jgi:hypothetical protein
MLAHGPSIITQGLVLALDAADRNSYPGSGTTWTDLSGGGNNGTLVNGVGYNSANGGSLVFDGVNDYVTITTLPSLSQFTVSLWVNVISITGENQIFYSNNDSVTITTFNSRYMVYTGTINQGSEIVTNIWKYVTIVGNGTSIRLYLNDVLDNSWNTGRTMEGGNTILGSYPGPSRVANIRVSSFKAYNRALTAAEIQQNFNATRSRFGI